MEGGRVGYRGVGGRGQGTFLSSCHILHYHMVLRPKGTSHKYPLVEVRVRSPLGRSCCQSNLRMCVFVWCVYMCVYWSVPQAFPRHSQYVVSYFSKKKPFFAILKPSIMCSQRVECRIRCGSLCRVVIIDGRRVPVFAFLCASCFADAAFKAAQPGDEFEKRMEKIHPE